MCLMIHLIFHTIPRMYALLTTCMGLVSSLLEYMASVKTVYMYQFAKVNKKVNYFIIQIPVTNPGDKAYEKKCSYIFQVEQLT